MRDCDRTLAPVTSGRSIELDISKYIVEFDLRASYLLEGANCPILGGLRLRQT